MFIFWLVASIGDIIFCNFVSTVPVADQLNGAILSSQQFETDKNHMGCNKKVMANASVKVDRFCAPSAIPIGQKFSF